MVKALTRSGTIVEKDAAENLDERDIDLVDDLDSTPMFFNEKMQKGLRSRDNRKKARKKHKSRSKRSRKVDERKQAGKVFEDPLTDEELDTWEDNPSEFDIEGVDTKDSGGFL